MKRPRCLHLKKHCRKEKVARFFTKAFFHRSKPVIEGIRFSLFLSARRDNNMNRLSDSKSTADRGDGTCCATLVTLVTLVTLATL